MYGVFSKFLKWVWRSSSSNNDNLRVIIDHMRNSYEKDERTAYWTILTFPWIITKSVLTENDYITTSDYIYQCYNNDGLRAVVVWINKNILLQLTKDTYITTEVKIRIATGMINKLVAQEKLNKDYGMVAHDILVANIRELQNDIMDEELPF